MSAEPDLFELCEDVSDDKARGYDWCFVVNNYSEEEVQVLEGLPARVPKLAYIVYGREIAPSTGTPHLQGYILFKDAISFLKLKKLLGPRAHIKKRYKKSNPKAASTYCKKDGKFWEYGELPVGQGKRIDFEITRDLVKQGARMNEIIDKATSYQTLRSAELILKYTEKTRTTKPYVLWVYGSSGTGKTRTAYEMFPKLYRKTNMMGQWFEGYDGHEDVLLDDIKDNSRQMYEMLLELLDRYDCRVPHKGGSRQFLGKNIVITSIKSPYELFYMYDNAEELLRRIDETRNLSIESRI